MCQKTPLVGETWVFRKPGGDHMKDWGECAGADRFTSVRGKVARIAPDGLDISNPDFECGSDQKSKLWLVAKIRWAAGWEPFLCLSEGETQEHPRPGAPPMAEIRDKVTLDVVDSGSQKLNGPPKYDPATGVYTWRTTFGIPPCDTAEKPAVDAADEELIAKMLARYARYTRIVLGVPKVGERWHFRSTGEGTFAWNGTIVGVGDDWWVGKTPHGPELLKAAAWKPVRQVTG